MPFEVLAAVCGRITKEASPIRIVRLKTNCGQAKSMIACTNGSLVALSKSLKAGGNTRSAILRISAAGRPHQVRLLIRSRRLTILKLEVASILVADLVADRVRDHRVQLGDPEGDID